MENNEIELSWIFKTLRRWLWMILICTILAGASAYFVTYHVMTPTYEAETTLLVDLAKSSGTSEYTLLTAGERLALTYSQMVKGQSILQDVAQQLGIEEVLDLTKMIDAAPVPNTQLIRLTAKDESPEQAARLANKTAEVLIQYLRNLQEERYAKSLESFQVQINQLSSLVVETQAQLDAAINKKIKADAELSRQQKLLDDYQRKYTDLQQNYQNLQLASDQLKNSINIIEPAHIIETRNSPLHTASVTFLLPSANLAPTYIQMLTGRSLIQDVITLLALPEPPELLATRVNAQVVRNTQLLELTLIDSDPVRATMIADALAKAFLTQVQQLATDPYDTQLKVILDEMYAYSPKIEQAQKNIESLTTDAIEAETEQTRLREKITEYNSNLKDIQQKDDDLRMTMAQAADSVVVTEFAQIPRKPNQNNILYVGVAIFVGLLIGLVTAFLLESFDNTFKTPEDISKKLGLSTLGTIKYLPKSSTGLIVMNQPRSPISEAFRVLATNIKFTSLDKPLKTILVTSPNPKEGKTFITSNLAAAISQTEDSAIAVDADLRLPTLHKIFGLDQGAGLTESILLGTVDGNLRTINPDRLSVLISGDLPPNPAEIVGSLRMKNLVEEISQKAKIVVLDSPPVLMTADSKTLATLVDGVLVVIRARQTSIQDAREAVESLRQVNANIIGVVLNADQRKTDGYYYSYHEPKVKRLPRVLNRQRENRFKGFPNVKSTIQNSRLWQWIRNIKIKNPFNVDGDSRVAHWWREIKGTKVPNIFKKKR